MAVKTKEKARRETIWVTGEIPPAVPPDGQYVLVRAPLFPELCNAGHLKYLSVKLKFIIYCKSCVQQHSDHEMI